MIKLESRKDWMKSRVVSSLPGRLRLRVNGLAYLDKACEELASDLARIEGVKRVRVTTITSGVLLEYDADDLTAAEIQERADVVLAHYAMTAFRARHVAGSDENHSMTTEQLTKRLIINGGAMVLGDTLLRGTDTMTRWGRMFSVEGIASLFLSWPMAQSAWRGLKRDGKPNADFLTVSSIVASLLLGSAHSALMILALSDLAELMTGYTIEKTRSSIKELLSVEEGSVWKVLEDGKQVRCAVGEIKPGDMVAVQTGEKIAVDGVVADGEALVDESAITGEFVPVEKKSEQKVFAGTVIKNGSLRIVAHKVGDQTVVSRIVGMVESSETNKAPIQRYADQFSNYLVPLNFLLCAAVWLVTRSPQKALKMLVIDYSCGIKLSTATAFSAAINRAVKRGILIKGGAYIEQMSGANTVLLDKTGTVTEGRPVIVSMKVLDKQMDEREVLSYAMAAEETSTHPLAGAILSYGRSMGVEIMSHGEIVTEVSRGTKTTVNGKVVRVGNMAYMRENGLHIPKGLKVSEAAIANFVGIDKRVVGILYAMDKPRENVRRAINSLRYDGVGVIELLTGDTEPQARAVAEAVGADGYRAHLLPEEKAEAVLKLQTQGHGVVMVGDGINDAPALAFADVGISLGSKSTDIAMETSDIVIGRDDPMMIPELRRLSRATMKVVRQNFAIVIGVNSLGLILGAASGISVMMSALLHNLSTIVVVGNSLRLLFFTQQEGR